MPAIALIEQALLDRIAELGIFALVQSAGRKALPSIYGYPACFVHWDGDTDTGTFPRPVDVAAFKVVIQSVNLAAEEQAAADAYELSDLVREAIRGKTLGLNDIEPLVCQSRLCTDYDDTEGMIEYTHTYSTRVYNAVPQP